MTSRSYFGKQNSTLAGPLCLWQCLDFYDHFGPFWKIMSCFVSLGDGEYVKICFFIVLCSTFSGGLNVISGVNDFLISDKKGKKTSSSQTRKVSTSDLQLVLLEVLSLLFNTHLIKKSVDLPSDPELFIFSLHCLHCLVISKVPHLGDPPPFPTTP